jgi:hypothetical protein
VVAQHELADLEEQGWRALSSTGAAAAEFYERLLDQTVVMVLPGGVLLGDRATIIESMSAQPWSSYQLQGLRAFQPTPDTGVVIYGVTAQRGNAAPYSALMSSTYVRRADGWKLAMHQQTPR